MILQYSHWTHVQYKHRLKKWSHNLPTPPPFLCICKQLVKNNKIYTAWLLPCTSPILNNYLLLVSKIEGTNPLVVVSKKSNHQQEMTCTLPQNSIKHQRTSNCKTYYPYEKGRGVILLLTWTWCRSADKRVDESLR